MKEETQVELLKLAGQLTAEVMNDKSGSRLDFVTVAKQHGEGKRPDYQAVFDYWLAHLKQALNEAPN